MTTITITKSKDAIVSKPPAKPSAGHRSLDVWLGEWNTQGQQYEGPVGPAAKITATDTFEWATGEFFMVHRFEGKVGDSDASCIEIIGYDSEIKSYPTHTYYNTGLTNDWQSHESDGTWTLTGDWDMAGKKAKARCTTLFSHDGNTMTGKWEMSIEGGTWQTFWDTKGTKAK